MTKLCDFSKSLIKYIGERPILYITSRGSLNLHTNMEKQRQWEEVAELTNKTVQECKSRWKNMKDSYRKALKKQSDGVPFDSCYLEALSFTTFYSEQEVSHIVEKINERAQNTKRELAYAKNETKVSVSDIVKQLGKRKKNKEDNIDLKIEKVSEYNDEIAFNKNVVKRNENVNTTNVYFQSDEINNFIATSNRPCSNVNVMDLQIGTYYSNSNDNSLSCEDNTALTVEDIQIEDVKTIKIEPEILNLKHNEKNESEIDISLGENITSNDKSSNEIPSKHATETEKDSLLDRILVRNENKALLKIMRKLNKQNKLLKRRLLKCKSRGHSTSTHSFFRSMADIVCKFPPTTIADVRMKVCTVVTSAEMESLPL